jgi:hypothetical protein
LRNIKPTHERCISTESREIKQDNYSEGVEGKRASVFPLAFERNVR